MSVMQPVGAAVFALDGLLIGANAEVVCGRGTPGIRPLALAAPILDLGVAGVWAALNVLMLVRLLICGAGFRGRKWAIVVASA